MKYCDLHTHSVYSDGTFTPEALIAAAKVANLSAVALTDHNTVAGLPHFLAAAEGSGVEARAAAVAQVTGVEGLDGAEPLLATERQRLCALRCLDCLIEAQTALDSGLTPDAACVSLTAAVEAILDLTGERATEAVVEQVFARFCVGK